MHSVHKHRTLTKRWLSVNVLVLILSRYYAIQVQGRRGGQIGQWIGLSAYGHEAQQGDCSTPRGPFLFQYCTCTVHRVLAFIVTNKRTINTITIYIYIYIYIYITTVSLCTVHCYMFRHILVTIRQFITNATLSSHVFSTVSPLFL